MVLQWSLFGNGLKHGVKAPLGKETMANETTAARAGFKSAHVVSPASESMEAYSQSDRVKSTIQHFTTPERGVLALAGDAI